MTTVGDRNGWVHRIFTGRNIRLNAVDSEQTGGHEEANKADKDWDQGYAFKLVAREAWFSVSNSLRCAGSMRCGVEEVKQCLQMATQAVLPWK